MISCILCHHKGMLVYNAVDSLLRSQDVVYEIIVATSDVNFDYEHWSNPKIRIIHVNGGPAHKRNIAYRFATGDEIAFFDDDIEVTPWTLTEMKSKLKDPKVGMVFGKLLNMERRLEFDEAGSFLTWSGFLWARAEGGVTDHGQYDKCEPVLAGKSAACMIKRSVFSEIGMFDASYEILGEETDLAWRVWLHGYQVLYVPSSVTFHAFNTKWKPADMYTPKRVYFNGCRNYLTMLYTNLGKRRWIIPVFTQLCVWTFAAIGMILTGKHEAGIYIFKGIFYFLRNIFSIWKKRFKVQRTIRTVHDNDLMPFIFRNPPASYYIKRLLHYIQTGRHG